MKRCAWAVSEISTIYHDREWGVPIHDDHKLFEFLILEGAQAGLNWETILKKREAYRLSFDNFDPSRVSSYDDLMINSLLDNPGIIRNRRKVESAVRNAQMFIKIQQEFGSFNEYIWNFVDGKPLQSNLQSLSEMPAETDLSKQISLDLRKRGMNFVGPTIMYAFMQAVGMVNDHTIDCFRHQEIQKMEKS